LPAELRVRIYDHLFAHSLVHISARNRLTHPANPAPELPRLIFTPSVINSIYAHYPKDYIHLLRSPDIGILATCRLFRREALPVFYDTATFQVNGNLEVGLEWLGSLTIKQKEKIKELRLRMHAAPKSEEADAPSQHEVARGEQRVLRVFEKDARFRGVRGGVLEIGLGSLRW
jgi:hypothetical protein